MFEKVTQVGNSVMESKSVTATVVQHKEPLFCRFMDSAINVVIWEELRSPLQPRAFDSGAEVDTMRQQASPLPIEGKLPLNQSKN